MAVYPKAVSRRSTTLETGNESYGTNLLIAMFRVVVNTMYLASDSTFPQFNDLDYDHSKIDLCC